VTGCDFLAYSCAAARDSHPLPSSSEWQGCANQRSCERANWLRFRKSTPLTAVKSIGTRWRRCGAGALARGFWLWSSLSGNSVRAQCLET